MKINFQILTFLVIILFSVIYIEINSQEIRLNSLEVLNFNKGLSSIPYLQDNLSRLEISSKIQFQTSKDCKSCHKQIYNNWYESRHRQAHSNELYQYSLSKEPMEWCENCHAPLRHPNSKKILLPEEGISCLTCHVRNQEIIVTKIPDSKEALTHNYKIIKDFDTAKLCESCHDFNFPSWESMNSSNHTIKYSNTSMQGTYAEWLSSGMRDESDCIDCHLSPGTKKSHRFPGGHSIEELKNSFVVRSRYLSGNTIAITIQSIRIAHAFPTGDLFRALKLNIYDSNGIFLKQFVLSKKYRLTSKNERKNNDSPKVLIEDTRIPPPEKGEDSSNKEFILNIDKHPKTIKIELWIDYLNDIEKFVSPIPESKSKKLILSEEIQIENRDDFEDSDRG